MRRSVWIKSSVVYYLTIKTEKQLPRAALLLCHVCSVCLCVCVFVSSFPGGDLQALTLSPCTHNIRNWLDRRDERYRHAPRRKRSHEIQPNKYRTSKNSTQTTKRRQPIIFDCSIDRSIMRCVFCSTDDANHDDDDDRDAIDFGE